MSSAVAHIIEEVEQLTPSELGELRRHIIERLPAETPTGRRPRVGTVTSAPVRWTPDSFAPLDDAGMRDLGLL